MNIHSAVPSGNKPKDERKPLQKAMDKVYDLLPGAENAPLRCTIYEVMRELARQQYKDGFYSRPF